MQPDKLWSSFASILQGGPVEKLCPDDNLPLPKKGEKVIGIVTDPKAVALWHLHTRIMNYVEDYKTAHGLDRGIVVENISDFMASQHNNHLREIVGVMEAVRKAFWFYTKRQFPEAANQDVMAGIRKDMQVVTTKREDPIAKLVSLISKIGSISILRMDEGFEPGLN